MLRNIDLLGTRIDTMSKDALLSYLDEAVQQSNGHRGGYVCFRDVHSIVRAIDDPDLARAHAKSLLNLPDGMPLVWIARWRGIAEAERLCGPDMMPAICAHGVARGWRHVLVGGTSQTVFELKARLSQKNPRSSDRRSDFASVPPS